MRANSSLPKRSESLAPSPQPSAQTPQLDTLVREEESGIVRREQSDHLTPQLLQTAERENDAEFEGGFWDSAPLDGDTDTDTDADPDASLARPATPRTIALHFRGRRLGAAIGFAIVFSVTMILLLGEAVAWLWRHV